MLQRPMKNNKWQYTIVHPANVNQKTNQTYIRLKFSFIPLCAEKLVTIWAFIWSLITGTTGLAPTGMVGWDDEGDDVSEVEGRVV